MIYKGGCLCEKVKYEVELEGEFDKFFLCHCERCRKDTGSAHAANLFSNKAELKWISGEDHIQIFDYKLDGHVRSFCRTCGSALPTILYEGRMLVVPAGSLDTEIKMRPQAHIFCDHRAGWDKELETVLMYSKLP